MITGKQELIDFIKNDYFIKGTNNSKPEYTFERVLNDIDSEVLEELRNDYPWTRKSNRFIELAYCVKHDINVEPRCPVCERPIVFYFEATQYNGTCSRQCATKYLKNPMKYSNDEIAPSEENFKNFVNEHVAFKETAKGIQVSVPLKFKMFGYIKDVSIVKYMQLKWPWAKTPREAIHCYANRIDKAPRCPICNKILQFDGRKITYGYAEFCSLECANKYSEEVISDQDNLLTFIRECYFQDNMTKTNRELCNEKKMQDSGFKTIADHVKNKVPFADTLTEAMYAYYHEIDEHPTCDRCGKLTRFVDVKHGYKNYCSLQCAKNSKAKITVELKSKEDLTFFIKETYFQENSNSPKSRWRNDRAIYKALKNKKALEELYNEYPWTRTSNRFLELAYCVKNDIKEVPKCPVCGEPVIFRPGNKSYNTYCSKMCFGLHIAIKAQNQNSDLDNVTLLSIGKKAKRFFEKNRNKELKNITVNWLTDRFKVSRYFIINRCEQYSIKLLDEPPSYKSSLETEMIDFLKSIDINFEENNRVILKGRELDFYIPEKKLAIEMNGMYWHTVVHISETRCNGDMQVAKRYHSDKFIKCQEANITLFQIHEHQWRDPVKQEIWKSRLASMFNRDTRVLYARKCEVKEISASAAKKFQDNTHLDGGIHAKINLGLYYDGELVSVMTFGKNRFKKAENESELYRYSVARNTRITGGASKLFKYYLKNYAQENEIIVSFSNNDYSNGNLYKQLGFEFAGITESYFYVSRNNITYNRLAVQKHKLPSLLGIDPSELANKTADQILAENGIKKIYTSGQSKWIYKT